MDQHVRPQAKSDLVDQRSDTNTFQRHHTARGPDGLVLEVTNALVESLQLAIVTPDDVGPLHADEVLAVRPLAPSA